MSKRTELSNEDERMFSEGGGSFTFCAIAVNIHNYTVEKVLYA